MVKEPARSIRGRKQPSNIEAPCKRDASDQIRDRIDERRSSKGFDKGQLVWLRNTQRKGDVIGLIRIEWEGPYTVIMRINDVNYHIQEGRRGKPKVVHFERLARYRGIMDPVRDEQA